jgi:hypothetical protein
VPQSDSGGVSKWVGMTVRKEGVGTVGSVGPKVTVRVLGACGRFWSGSKRNGMAWVHRARQHGVL